MGLEEHAPGLSVVKVTVGIVRILIFVAIRELSRFQKRNVTQCEGQAIVKEDGVGDSHARRIWSFFGYHVERDGICLPKPSNSF